MKTYRLKGPYSNERAYLIDEAVSYEGRYYLAIKNNIKGISPTDPNKPNNWKLTPSYTTEVTVDGILTWTELLDKDVPYMSGSNDVGLYKFPKKEQIATIRYPNYKGEWDYYNGYLIDEIILFDSIYYICLTENFAKRPDVFTTHWGIYGYDSEAHFKLMGVEMYYEYAKKFYNDNLSSMPNITGIYLVQGERKKNVITQGYSVASVEAVGFQFNFKNLSNESKEINQVMKLGNTANDYAFPLLGANDYRLFPIIKISKSRKGHYDTDTPVYRMEPEDISELLVMTKEQRFETPKNTSSGDDNKYDKEYWYDFIMPKNLSNTQLTRLDDVSTDKFCIYTPDILLDNTISIPSNVYIKPIKKINYKLDNELNINEAIRDYTPYRIASILTRPRYSRWDIESVYIHKDSEIQSLGNRHRYLNPYLEDYISTPEETQSVYKVSASVIQESTVKGPRGFSTQMKSLIDVFGYDYKTFADNQSDTITQYLASSRNQLYSAGVMLNQTKESVGDNEAEQAAMIMTKKDIGINQYYKVWPFGAPKLIYPYESSNTQNALPLIATNLSMRSLPYIGIQLRSPGKYSINGAYETATLKTSDSGLEETYSSDKYTNLHNAIVNVCTYCNQDEYVDEVNNEFDLINEPYSMISYNDNWKSQQDGPIIYRGDIISQKTFMRAIRWDTIPEITLEESHEFAGLKYDFEYSWKFGQAFNIYLQSRVNGVLRVPSHDTIFYPYVKTFYPNDTDALKNFIWKNESVQYQKESWLTNQGYSKMNGLAEMYALTEQMLRKDYRAKNRIYYSNVHVGGSIVDQYRSIPSGQYMDFNFEGGDIMYLAKINNILFSIQRYSINQHYPSQKLETATDSSSIILGDKNVLSDNYRQLAVFGTQHKESIVNGERGIYGVDWNKEKIWRINKEVSSTGSVFYQCVDLVDTKMIFDIFKRLKSDNDELEQNIYRKNEDGFESARGIISTYDAENKQILFTFHNLIDGVEKYHTLVFNEQLDVFTGFVDYDVNYYFSFDNRLLSFTWATDNVLLESSLWEHNKGEYLNIFDKKRPLELSFIINGLNEQQNTVQFEKEFQAHLINMCSEELEFMKWETTWQKTDEEPFIKLNEFWRNPDYQEHMWRVPILVNVNENKGPLGSEEFSTFESNSYMKGQWLKVTLKYMPKDNTNVQFYLKNIITNFIISYS